MSGDPVSARLEALAADVGRLSRRLANDPPESYLRFLVGRIREQVDGLDAMLGQTAAELASAYAQVAPGEAVNMALEAVDERARHLRRLLGDERPES